MRVCPRPRSAFPRWWVGLGGGRQAPQQKPSQSASQGKPAEHRLPRQAEGRPAGIAREAV
jgi:hypothetical protein